LGFGFLKSSLLDPDFHGMAHFRVNSVKASTRCPFFTEISRYYYYSNIRNVTDLAADLFRD